MMGDVYSEMTTMKLGIYSHSVISAAPSYSYDKRYGPLAILPAPFCALSFIMIPYYLCVSDNDRLKKAAFRFS